MKNVFKKIMPDFSSVSLWNLSKSVEEKEGAGKLSVNPLDTLCCACYYGRQSECG